MKTLIVFGALGLLFGMTVQACGLSRRETVQAAAGFLDRRAVKTALYLLGGGMALTGVLCWLAVIDVDLLRVMPVHGGAVVGGLLVGAAVGLAGFLPGTALCGLGGGRFAEALCALIGCAVGWLCAGWLPMDALRGWLSGVNGTLFRVTLRDEWLLNGSTGALILLGLLLCGAARLIRSQAAETQTLQEAPCAEELLDDLEDETDDDDLRLLDGAADRDPEAE